MNSFELTDNFKYYGKILIITLIVFLILKFIVYLKTYEAMLLSLIIAVSILIIENIILVSDNISNPLDCNQCKISLVTDNDKKIKTEQNESNEPNEPNQPNQQKETFVMNEMNSVKNAVDSLLNQITEKINSTIDNDMELKCHLVNKINIPTEQNIEIQENFSNLDDLENFISEQKKQNSNLTNKIKNNLSNNLSQPVLSQPVLSQPVLSQPVLSQPVLSQLEQKIKPVNNEIKYIDETLEDPYLARAGLLNEITATNPDNTIPIPTGPQPEPNPIPEQLEKPFDLNKEQTYDSGYVRYQKDGLEKEEGDVSLQNNVFRLSVGEPSVVKPYLNDGKDYYNRIYSYSSSSPNAKEALNNELRYGDFNYISPLNKGMTNSDYTFVSPNNWYPIPPHPPVCVTNKTAIVTPIQITDGKDYMSWASLEDFDKARRFTGNMGINIDYVKNVLNNDDGY
jgi:hypothetical protein